MKKARVRREEMCADSPEMPAEDGTERGTKTVGDHVLL